MPYSAKTDAEGYSKGEENRLSQNVPLWYTYYFELEDKAQKTQEELFTSSLTASKNLNREPGSGRELSPETMTEYG